MTTDLIESGRQGEALPRRRPRRARGVVPSCLALAAVALLGARQYQHDLDRRSALVGHERAYVAALHGYRLDWVGGSGSPADFTDAELLRFGRMACTSLAAGRTEADLDQAYGYYVLGDERGLSNPYLPVVAAAAAHLLCPDAGSAGEEAAQPGRRTVPSGAPSGGPAR